MIFLKNMCALYGDRSYVPSLVLSMRYLHGTLAAMEFQGSVKVSSAHASSVLAMPPALGVPSPSSLPLLVAAARFPLSLHSVLLGDDAAGSSSSQLPIRASLAVVHVEPAYEWHLVAGTLCRRLPVPHR